MVPVGLLVVAWNRAWIDLLDKPVKGLSPKTALANGFDNCELKLTIRTHVAPTGAAPRCCGPALTGPVHPHSVAEAAEVGGPGQAGHHCLGHHIGPGPGPGAGLCAGVSKVWIWGLVTL